MVAFLARTAPPRSPPRVRLRRKTTKNVDPGLLGYRFLIGGRGQVKLLADLLFFYSKLLIGEKFSVRNIVFYALFRCFYTRVTVFCTHSLFLLRLYIYLYYVIEKKENIYREEGEYREFPTRGLRILGCSYLRGLGMPKRLTRDFSAGMFSYKKQMLKHKIWLKRGFAGKSAPTLFFRGCC